MYLVARQQRRRFQRKAKPSSPQIRLLLLQAIFLVSLCSLKAQEIEVISVFCDFEVNAQIVHPRCAGDQSGRILLSSISTDGTAIEFQWLGDLSNDANNNELNDLAQGNYSVIASSLNCQDTLSFALFAPDPIIAPPLDTSICGSGTINVLEGVSGGTGNYSVQVTTIFGATQDCPNCPTVEVNSYTILSVEITDENGCIVERPVVVNVKPALEAAATVLQPETCDDNGVIQIEASGGTDNFLYRRLNINNPEDPTNNYQASNIFGGLAGGNTYLFQVYDPDAACRTNVEASLGIAPVAIEATVQSSDISCFNANDGSIALFPDQNDQVAGYSLNNSNPNSPDFQTEANFDGLAPGTYTVFMFASDNEACKEFEIELTEPEPIDFQIETSDATCDNSSNGLIAFTGGGGTGELVFAATALENPTDATSFSPSPIIDTLSPGIYLAQVMDSQGCTADTLFSIEAPEPPPVNTLIVPSCPNENTGSIVIVESGKLVFGFYEYSLDTMNWQTDTIFSNLEPGLYTLYVRNPELDCIFDDSHQLLVEEVSPPDVVLTLSPPSCPGLMDGTVSIEISSTNTGSYEYSLDGMEYFSVSIFTNLGADNYTLFVRDQFGCVFVFPFEIEAPTAPTFNFAVERIQCHGDINGQIKLEITGGNIPFEHSINGESFQEETVFANLGAGDYVILSRDANGCLFANNQTLEQPEEINPNLQIVHETCSEANGILSCAPSGGLPPYEVLWSNGATTNLLTNLMHGMFGFTITDAAACAVMNDVSLEDMAGPELASEPTNVHCNGSSSGAINLEVVGGTMPYEYFWSHGANTEDVSGLPAGNYSVTVIDQNACETRRIYTIYEPNPISLDVETGRAGETWFINLSVEGGVSPYRYNWSNGEDTQDIFNLSPGEYMLTVTDDQNCSVQQSIVVGSTSTSTPNTSWALGIYPNPVSTQFIIETNYPSPKKAGYQLLGINGQVLQFGFLEGSRTSLSIDLPSGFYLLKTDFDGIAYFQKLIVVD